MEVTFIFPEGCKVETSGNTVKVITETSELNAPVVIKGKAPETNRYLQVKDKGHEIKAGIK